MASPRISVWILGDQLLMDHPALAAALEQTAAENITVVLVESTAKLRMYPWQRKKLVLKVRELAEAGRVALRNIRRDANKSAATGQKDKAITEDDAKRCKDGIQELIPHHAFLALSCEGYPWTEIDFPHDLERACALFEGAGTG